MKFTLICLATFSFCVAATESKCPSALNAWVPTVEDKLKFVAKIIEHTGPDKMFESLDGGNVGLHAYVLPPETIANVTAIAAAIPHGKLHLPSLKTFDSAKQSVVAVVETEDEPIISLILFTKNEDRAWRVAYRLEPVDGENEAMRALVPAAWSTGYYEYYHIIWEMVHRGEELSLPYKYPTHAENWSIDNYE